MYPPARGALRCSLPQAAPSSLSFNNFLVCRLTAERAYDAADAQPVFLTASASIA